MKSIDTTELSNPEATVSVLSKSLHGGFVPIESLTERELDVCEQEDWMEEASKFSCPICGDTHVTKANEEKCLRTYQKIDSNGVERGYKLSSEMDLQIPHDTDYNFFLKEASSAVDTYKLPYKSIVFVHDIEQITLADKAGGIVFVPLNEIERMSTPEELNDLIERINEERKKLINWEALSEDGSDFEEIVYRLIWRNDKFFNESWGGSGPDQGKDGYCSIDLGGSPTRILVQMKSNPGSSVSSTDIDSYLSKAYRHDCRGLIIAAVNTSGDFESEFQSGAFHNRDVHFFQVWAGPDLKEMISAHPDLIAEYFLS